MVCVNVNRRAFLDLLSEYDDYLDNLNFEFSDGLLRLFSTLYEDHIITYPFKDYKIVCGNHYTLFVLFNRGDVLRLRDFIKNIPSDVDYIEIKFCDLVLVVKYYDFTGGCGMIEFKNY